MAPFWSCKDAITFDITRIGFIAMPPYMPECKSNVGPVMVNSSPKSPRSMVTMAGVLLSNSPVSQISARSERNSSAFSFMKGTRLGEPDSSSPSKKKVMRQGSVPFTSFHARQASTKVINWPLSSDDPRPRITLPFAVSSICGSNGLLSQRSSGSTGCTS